MVSTHSTPWFLTALHETITPYFKILPRLKIYFMFVPLSVHLPDPHVTVKLSTALLLVKLSIPFDYKPLQLNLSQKLINVPHLVYQLTTLQPNAIQLFYTKQFRSIQMTNDLYKFNSSVSSSAQYCISIRPPYVSLSLYMR